VRRTGVAAVQPSFSGPAQRWLSIAALAESTLAGRPSTVRMRSPTVSARAAGVHRFVDSLITDHYAAAERDRFLAGLAAVDAQARSRYGKAFVESATGQQVALLRELDAAAYAATRGDDAWFFRRMKELTLVGYYTSEIGAMQELHVSPFGAYRGDIPYASVGRAWS